MCLKNWIDDLKKKNIQFFIVNNFPVILLKTHDTRIPFGGLVKYRLVDKSIASRVDSVPTLPAIFFFPRTNVGNINIKWACFCPKNTIAHARTLVMTRKGKGPWATGGMYPLLNEN